MNWILLLIVFLSTSVCASSFAVPSAPWQNILDIFSGSSKLSNLEETRRRAEIKQRLSTECKGNFGVNNKETRQKIKALIEEIAPLNPTKETSLSPLLKREWVLLWTSEKEINFFLEKGISESITQTLSADILENYIPFVKGGGFGVTGEIRPAEKNNDEMLRTQFKFLNAKLDIGKWGVYNFPPVGEGWFDTIYLDEDLRIDTNSRDDILICRAGKD
mmetsp:Transcript_1725/g.3888  ORF Transcript_1725/g.3888 Transcript_1725/m.3888 type:complete len:218 (-) Transcript_1725:1510-2163(-)